MQEYLEEIEFDRHLFFKGVAFLKYGGKLNKYDSEKSGFSLFRHVRYYDIEIRSIEELSQEEYRNWKKLFELRNLEGSVIGLYDGSEYDLKLDVIYIHEELQLTHNQVEGDDLHGYFDSIPVAFKMHKKEKAIACRKDLATGNEEQRNDGVYAEFYSGEFLDPEAKTCATYWKKISGTKCIEGAETGEIEYDGNRFRKQYYHSNCDTYWGEWSKEKCIKGSWTGEQREKNGWIQREYYNSDCSTYWEDYKEIITKDREGGTGCSDLFPLIPVLFILGLLIWLSFKFHTIIPILFGIGLPLALYLLSLLISVFDKYPRQTSFIGLGIFRLFQLFVLISLLNGLISVFNKSNWSSKEERKKERRTESTHTWSVDEVEEYTATDPDGGRSATKKKRTKLKIQLEWSSVDGEKHDGTYELFKDEILASSSNLKSARYQNYRSYSRLYDRIYRKDRVYLNSVYSMLDSIRDTNELNRMEFANVITGLVQSIDYVLILEESCNDPTVLLNAEIRDMLRKGVDCEGNAPYGIKTPLEFLSSMNGDCDTRTLLLYTLFKHFNYDVAIINSDFYGHSMLGLNLNGIKGVYKKYEGKSYYFWETTSRGFGLGELPREMGQLSFWKIEIN